MQLRHRVRLRDEEGATLVELLVGMGMGMVVLAGLSMVLIVTLHGNARVDARVEATDNARVTMTRIIEELHSACVEPTIAPVKEGSTSETLIFSHGPYGSQTGAGGTPSPSQTAITSKIEYSEPEQTLTEYHPPSSEPRILLSNVSPISAEEPVFSYWKYHTGTPERLIPGAIGLNGGQADETILVKIAFAESPKNEPVSDSGATTAIRNSATLRLTPPAYNATTVKPCQ